MKAAHAASTNVTAATPAGCAASATAVAAQLAAMQTKARHLARVPIARCSVQSRSGVPKAGCVSSHRSSRGEEREKHQAASSRNGVVGRTGRMMPAAPRPSIVVPANSSIGLLMSPRIPTSRASPLRRARPGGQCRRIYAPAPRRLCDPSRANRYHRVRSGDR